MTIMKIKHLLSLTIWYSLFANTIFASDLQDSLRGSNGRGRAWWDVKHYTLSVAFDTAGKTISGNNQIRATVISNPSDSLQLDLQELMFLDSVVLNRKRIPFAKQGNVWWIKYPFNKMPVGSEFAFTAYYHGKPRIAENPPWNGGFIWTQDSAGKPWIAVACQGLGASSWWPCKDYQGDEPDDGMDLNFIIPPGLGKAIGNGRLEHVTEGNYPFSINDEIEKATRKFSWRIKNPINSYNASFYIGDYISWTDTLMGERGKLDMSFYALRYNEEKSRKQFSVVKDMLRCFEYWMGPYPFYEDGYKLVEAPYLGMEHQSAVAYGNQYKMGYLGMDRSGTGVGLLFDFIIVHESGHEWFGNNITAKDIADNWIHEGFTTYSETLFTECLFGKEKAFEYTLGQWKNISNSRPVIGNYGVHQEGSGDEYEKGAAVIHTIRKIMSNDERFRQLLRALNRDFYHKTVTSSEIENYISQFAGYDFSPLFNQYLRTTKIPKLTYRLKKNKLQYRFEDAVEGFTLPLGIQGKKTKAILHPSPEWKEIKWKDGYGFEIDKNFLIQF